MESEIMSNSTPINDRVVFELAGIDKKWVRSKNNEWVELKDVDVEIDEMIPTQEIEVKTRKKWQFWKKS
jgi:hypothetical protein